MTDAPMLVPDTRLSDAPRRFCEIMRTLCTIAIVLDLLLIAVIAVASLFRPPTLTVFRSREYEGPALILLIVAWAALPLWALWNARSCFDGFARGELFSVRTLGGLRAFVAAFLLLELAGVVAKALGSAFGPDVDGARAMAVTLHPVVSADGVLTIALLGLLLALCNVLTRAARIAEDNAQIV